MTTAYTSLLGLALPVTGELSGTWGSVVNDSITSLVDTSVAGTTNVSADSNVTLTTTTGASNQARQAILLFSGARTAIRTVTAPAQSKIYTVINATTGGFAVTLVGAGPTTGVTIVAGESAVCAWNGSDFVKVSNTGGSGTFTNLTVTGVATFSAGSAAAPAITTTGDTNTGIFFPAADTIAFAEGGAEIARFDSSGNLGVGTSSPSSFGKSAFVATTGSTALYAGSSTQGVYISNSTGTDVVYNASGSFGAQHVWQSGNVERARLTAGGDFGIGVIPTTKLHVVGSANNAGPFITFQATSANSTFNWVSTAFASNMTTGNLVHFIGKDGSTNNAGYFGFQYNGAGSVNNLLTLGFFANDNIFNINGNGNVSLKGATTTASGVGITFPATQSASTDANTLDDYEEGTWTPSLGSEGGGSSATYNFISGRYRKIGNLVIAQWGLNVATWTAGSGTLQISGLPFTSISIGAYQEPTTFLSAGQFATAYALYAGQVYMFVGNGSTTMFGRYLNNSDTAMNPAAIQGGSAAVGTYIGGTMIYIASS